MTAQTIETVPVLADDETPMPGDYEIRRTLDYPRTLFGYLPDACGPCYVGRMKYIHQNAPLWASRLALKDAVERVVDAVPCGHDIDEASANSDIEARIRQLVITQRVVTVELP